MKNFKELVKGKKKLSVYISELEKDTKSGLDLILNDYSDLRDDLKINIKKTINNDRLIEETKEIVLSYLKDEEDVVLEAVKTNVKENIDKYTELLSVMDGVKDRIKINKEQIERFTDVDLNNKLSITLRAKLLENSRVLHLANVDKFEDRVTYLNKMLTDINTIKNVDMNYHVLISVYSRFVNSLHNISSISSDTNDIILNNKETLLKELDKVRIVENTLNITEFNNNTLLTMVNVATDTLTIINEDHGTVMDLVLPFTFLSKEKSPIYNEFILDILSDIFEKINDIAIYILRINDATLTMTSIVNEILEKEKK
jgi:hypothetical protein